MAENVTSSLKSLIPKNQFARGVSVLVGGTVGSQALLILSAPLLTRLYTPSDFGLLAVYAGLLALFAVVASLRYEQAIPIPKADADAGNVLYLSLGAVFVMTGISALVVGIAGGKIAGALNVPKLAPYLWLLPVGVFLSGSYKVFNYWAVRRKNFSDIAKTRIGQTFFTLAIQLFGYPFGVVALLLGQAGGQGVGSYRLVRSALRNKGIQKFSWLGLWQAAKRYKHFPFFSTWAGLANTLGNQLPPLMIAVLFSSTAAGFFALAQRILGVPVSVVSEAVGKVFLSNALEAKRNGQLGRLVERIHVMLFQIIVPPALILILGGPEIFSIVFGENWRQAGDIARWITPWLILVFVLSPFMVVFEFLEKQAAGLFFQLALLFLRAGALYIGYMQGDVMLAIKLFCLSSVLSLLGFNYWLSTVTNSDFGIMAKAFFYKGILGILPTLPIIVAMQFFDSTFVFLFGVVLSIGLSLIYYLKIFLKYRMLSPW